MMGRSSLGVSAIVWAGVIALGCAPSGNDASLTGGGVKGPDLDSDAGTTEPASARASHLPCDVDRILKSNCQGCHGTNPQFGASDPLVTYDDVHVVKGETKLYERIHDRIHDATRPMPPQPNERLSDADLQVMDAWIAAGAPSSEDSCDGDSDAGNNLGPKPLNCTPDTVVRAPKPYVMPKANDLYVCVGVPLPVQGRRHITAIAPHIDNYKILHHVLLMQATEPVSETPYVCTGAEPWKLVAGWAPGGENLVMPPEAGFPYDSNTRWALQLHYNNATKLEGEQDQSGFEFCTTDKLRENDAGVVAFGSMVFSLPPRAKTTVKCSWVAPPSINTNLKIGGIRLIQSWPHMHNLGTAMKTTVDSVGGTSQLLVDEQNFSFQNQVSHPAALDVKPGDVINTTCSWNNTTDKTVTWGEGTSSEMCYNYTTYYPAIGGDGVTSFPWWEPSLGAVCTSSSD